MTPGKTIAKGFALTSSILLAGGYILYASGFLMPSTKSGRIVPPDLEQPPAAPLADATTSPVPPYPGSELLPGSKSRSNLFAMPIDKLLLTSSKAPAGSLVQRPAPLDPTSQRPQILMSSSKSSLVDLPTPTQLSQLGAPSSAQGTTPQSFDHSDIFTLNPTPRSEPTPPTTAPAPATAPATRQVLLPGSKSFILKAPTPPAEPSRTAPATPEPARNRQLLPGSKAPDFIFSPRKQEESPPQGKGKP